MNLDYLKNEIIPQRENEIKSGKNACTAQPIYVVFDLIPTYLGGHDPEGWSNTDMLNNKRKSGIEGYLDTGIDCEDREFCEDSTGMISPDEVTEVYYDRFVAFFLTRKGAEDYLEYQRHNLSDPYIYTFHSGYANKEMNQFLNGM